MKHLPSMESQTCVVCGKVGSRRSFHPDSGWDWWRSVRLCPACAPKHKALIKTAQKTTHPNPKP